MSNSVSSRNEWIFSKYADIVNDKEELAHSYISMMLRRSVRLFKYNNLPDSIPQKELEILLQVGGNAIITKVNDKLYAFWGTLGGRPNQYYLPTIAVVANPALSFSATLPIDYGYEIPNQDETKCVVVLNDSLYQGLMPMFNKYASLLTECDISMRIATVNARIPSLIQADNDESYKSALMFLKQLTDGRENGVIASNNFFDGVKTMNFSEDTSVIKNLIELRQYLYGSMFNELGLQASFNMKREAINQAEAGMNDDILKPLIDDMLEQRKLGLERINKMFGTNITVELDSAWKTRDIEEDLSIDLQKATIENLKEEPKEDEKTDNKENKEDE